MQRLPKDIFLYLCSYLKKDNKDLLNFLAACANSSVIKKKWDNTVIENFLGENKHLLPLCVDINNFHNLTPSYSTFEFLVDLIKARFKTNKSDVVIITPSDFQRNKHHDKCLSDNGISCRNKTAIQQLPGGSERCTVFATTHYLVFSYNYPKKKEKVYLERELNE